MASANERRRTGRARGGMNWRNCLRSGRRATAHLREVALPLGMPMRRAVARREMAAEWMDRAGRRTRLFRRERGCALGRVPRGCRGGMGESLEGGDVARGGERARGSHRVIDCVYDFEEMEECAGRIDFTLQYRRRSRPARPPRNLAPGVLRTRRSGRGPDAPRTAPGRAPDQPRTRPDARRTRRTAPDFAGRKSQDVRRTRPGRSRAPPDAAGRGRTPSAGRGPDRAGPAPDAGAKIPDAPDAPDAPGRAGRRRTLPDAPGRGSRTRRTRPPDAAPGREPDAPRTPG